MDYHIKNMNVHIRIPYSIDKNLGRAYNIAMQSIPDGDWACLIDYDVQFLLPESIQILYTYADQADKDALYTCYTNRIHPQSPQLLNGFLCDDADIRYHYQVAKAQKEKLYQVTPLETNISGFLMLLHKDLWQQFHFNEDGKCLGVDTEFSKRLLAASKEIYRMDGLYVFHQYRIVNGIKNKEHLL